MTCATGTVRSSRRTRADIVPLKYDWSAYKTVVLPTVIMLSAEDTQRLADFAAAGGRVVIGYATGLIDENFHTWLGGYPGAGDGLLREMLGIRGEEFNILGAEAEGEPSEIRLSSGAVTRLWQNDVNVDGERAQVLATYEGEEADEWELGGTAAITRNPYGSGETYFVGCDLNVADLTEFVRENIVEDSANVANPTDSDVLHTVRKSADATFDFYLRAARKKSHCRASKANQSTCPSGSRGTDGQLHRASQRRTRRKARIIPHNFAQLIA